MPAGRAVHIFTPEQIGVLRAAFEAVCARRHLRPGERATERAAIIIAYLATAGVLDFEAITTAALAEFDAARRESGA
jgi:hypothetical protein